MSSRWKIVLSSSICVVSLSGVAYAGTRSHQTQPTASSAGASSSTPSSDSNVNSTNVAFPISPAMVPQSPESSDNTYVQSLYIRDSQAYRAEDLPNAVSELQQVKVHAIAEKKALAAAKAKARAKALLAKHHKSHHSVYYVSYKKSPKLSSRGTSLSSLSGGTGQRAAELALSYVGTPYRWAGSAPGGFDCSGLVKYVYGRLGVPLAHSSYADFSVGQSVSSPQVGDLVFFSTYGPGASHVGIYVGGGRFVSAAGSSVRVDSLGDSYWARSYLGARHP